MRPPEREVVARWRRRLTDATHVLADAWVESLSLTRDIRRQTA